MNFWQLYQLLEALKDIRPAVEPTKLEPSSYHTRWMIRRDMPQVAKLKMDAMKLHPEFDEEIIEEFLNHLRQRNMIGEVAEIGEEIGGYSIWRLHPNTFEVIEMIAANEDATRSMVNKLLNKLESYLKRSLLIINFHESQHATVGGALSRYKNKEGDSLFDIKSQGNFVRAQYPRTNIPIAATEPEKKTYGPLG